MNSQLIDSTWLIAPSVQDDNDSESYEAVVDTGRWKPMVDYFQLRMQMLFLENQCIHQLLYRIKVSI